MPPEGGGYDVRVTKPFGAGADWRRSAGRAVPFGVVFAVSTRITPRHSWPEAIFAGLVGAVLMAGGLTLRERSRRRRGKASLFPEGGRWASLRRSWQVDRYSSRQWALYAAAGLPFVVLGVFVIATSSAWIGAFCAAVFALYSGVSAVQAVRARQLR